MHQKDKRSFFERLTGTVHVSDDEVDLYDYNQTEEDDGAMLPSNTNTRPRTPFPDERRQHAIVNPPLTEVTALNDSGTSEPEDGELAVDMYQTDHDIVIQAMIAGVRPSDITVSITRDTITIRGKRRPPKNIPEENYFYNELYWGSFSRKLTLPEEVNAEEAEAFEKHGLLMLRLPKLDPQKALNIKVQSA